jgi:hypothetical protein
MEEERSEYREFVERSGIRYLKHQEDFMRFALRNEREKKSGGGCFDDMGVGKTIQIIGLIECNVLENTLIVMPVALLEQWKRALKEISGINIITPVNQKILEIYQEALSKNIYPQPEYFLSLRNQEIKQEVIHLITQKHDIYSLWEVRHQIFTAHESDDLAKSTHDNILRFKQKIIKNMLDEAKAKIKEIELGGSMEEELNSELMVYMELKKILIEIDNQLGIVIS